MYECPLSYEKYKVSKGIVFEGCSSESLLLISDTHFMTSFDDCSCDNNNHSLQRLSTKEICHEILQKSVQNPAQVGLF